MVFDGASTPEAAPPPAEGRVRTVFAPSLGPTNSPQLVFVLGIALERPPVRPVFDDDEDWIPILDRLLQQENRFLLSTERKLYCGNASG